MERARRLDAKGLVDFAPWQTPLPLQVGGAVKKKSKAKALLNHAAGVYIIRNLLRHGITTEWCMESVEDGMESRAKGRGDARQAVMPYARWAMPYNAKGVDSLPKT